MALRALSLCAGIGGLDLGLHALGVVSVGYVERDAYAAACLVARMADAALDPGPVWSDVATFDGVPWRGRVDLVAAGYPCQPFSVAGRKRGAADPRHLWPHVARIVGEVRPRLVVLENVAGHVRLGLRDVLGDLAALGFDAEWGVFAASAVGAPHQRERIFVVAWEVSDAGRLALGQLAERDLRGEAVGRDAQPGDVGGAGSGQADADGLGPLGSGLAGDGRGRDGAPGNEPDGRGPEATDVELADDVAPEPWLRRARGAPLPWPPASDDRDAWARVVAERPDLAPALERAAAAEPALRGVAHGATDRLDGNPDAAWADRLRCLGNAVVPMQAATAVRALARRGLT